MEKKRLANMFPVACPRQLFLIQHNHLAKQVDEAYDILLMKSFSRRKAGQVSEEGIRFADVRKARPANLTPAWLKSALSKVAVSVETPDSKTLATEAAVFGVLAAWTFAGGLAQGGDLTPVPSGGDVPGLQLALALGAAFYFLQKERVKAGEEFMFC